MNRDERATGLAELAGLVADRTRAAFCLALLDGRAWTARELAAHAGVAESTASAHLGRLVAGGLLVERRQGRHRYLQLAGDQAAELLEVLAAYPEPVVARPRTLRAAIVASALARGRTCYDHLAGRLGVALTDAMVRDRLLDTDSGFALTAAGRAWFADALGVDLDAQRRTRRPLVRACLDWTERRTHLAGVAGAQLCQKFHANGWLRQVAGGRAVRLTSSGASAVSELFGLDPAAVDGR